MSEKVVIDFSSKDLLKSKLDLIYKMFRTGVEFGEIASSTSKQMKIFVFIIGDKKDRDKAKKFINALCNPEFSQRVQVNKKILETLQSKNFLNKIICDKQVYIEILSDKELVIQGSLEEASEVKCILDLEINRLKTPIDFTIDDNDEVICLNDPYEIFLNENETKNANTKKSTINSGIHEDDLLVFEPKKNDELEIIHFVPSKSTINSKQPEIGSANKTLNEYAELFSQEYDRESEKLNKPKRIDKLISLMPNEQKIHALNHVNSYQKKNLSFAHSQPVLTQSTLLSDINNSNDKGSNLEVTFEPKNESRRARNRKNNKQETHVSVERNSSLFTVQNQTQRSKSNAPIKKKDSTKLRYIIIDGSNVAREHGKKYGTCFSCKGIKIAVDYFLNRGHTEITALVPRFRRGNSDKECPTRNPEILDDLEKNGYLRYTPSQIYDDRVIIEAAFSLNAVIVSNDKYKDLRKEKHDWKDFIEKNLLEFTVVDDFFIVTDDALGRNGPKLDEFLAIKHNNVNNLKKSNLEQQQNNNNNQRKNSNQDLIDFKRQDTSKVNFIPNISQDERTSIQTSSLILSLMDIFPNNENRIKQLVNSNRSVRDINFFINRLMK
ncbi:unnamed protein product [Brachionus calyciflorus]|uniref:RNase NYN domain-containing protein n=1 Tax=Brachionus calyciflorus TaxID=104777 RepID=A0A813M5E7_9BILA|nr:unnamed protein product [Brachionus calyciflorus]